jgi:hypothetical protein
VSATGSPVWAPTTIGDRAGSSIAPQMIATIHSTADRIKTSSLAIDGLS